MIVFPIKGARDQPKRSINPRVSASRNAWGTGGTDDKIDLRDLLVGEQNGTGSDAINLESYLHFNTSGGTTTISVSTTGTVGASHDQEIVLQGVDMTTLGADDSAIISSMLAANKLIVDA